MSDTLKHAAADSAEVAAWLPIGSLTFDTRVNRPLDPRRVAEIARDFDPEAVGVLVVSARSDGTYVVLDGQHRRAALVRAGFGADQRVPCDVRHGLTLAQEAALFVRLNNTTKPLLIHRFLRRVTAGDEAAAAIDAIARGAGFEVSEHSGDGRIVAVAALEAVYAGRGPARGHGPYPDILEGALRVLAGAYGHTADAVNGLLIQGVGLLIARYGDAVDRATLVAKLAKVPAGANGLLAKARGMREYQGGSVPRCVAEVCVTLYNAGKRGGRLEDWRS